MTIDEITRRREREIEVRAWYHQQTGRHVRSRNHLREVMRDYQIARAIEIVLATYDTESNQ